MKQYFLAITMALVVAACNSNTKPSEKSMASDTSNHAIKAKYTTSMVDNKIDLSCGMPLTAGIEDTCHYNGKVYGFCSKECKDDFLKNPAGAIKEK
jgi:YHS domain-containing protein